MDRMPPSEGGDPGSTPGEGTHLIDVLTILFYFVPSEEHMTKTEFEISDEIERLLRAKYDCCYYLLRVTRVNRSPNLLIESDVLLGDAFFSITFKSVVSGATTNRLVIDIAPFQKLSLPKIKEICKDISETCKVSVSIVELNFKDWRRAKQLNSGNVHRGDYLEKIASFSPA